MTQLGKLLMIAAGVVFLVGLLFYWQEKIPWLGKLPGDIVIKRNNFSFYFPLATCLLISIIISLLIFLINRIR